MDKNVPAPIFVQNPDGSFAQGNPPGFLECTPPDTPRAMLMSPNASNLRADVVKVLAKHECMLLSLVMAHVVASLCFGWIQVKYQNDSLVELAMIYPGVSTQTLSLLVWVCTSADVSYSCAFFFLGVACAFLGRSEVYARYATVAVIGTLAELPLAYLNRFNLLIFFLRFLSYAYARFLCNLLSTIDALIDTRIVDEQTA
eukprot:TRINITY_DN41605_c0_g1_i1.p1 TRINITY_DN41605_c0_g1~~TRINITY_DN41605_c0_g1_i1.p1  ORF type:complete len:200 (-),score=29.37 TRINITY_DN41605_c0_g1_i1:143-742(-)